MPSYIIHIMMQKFTSFLSSYADSYVQMAQVEAHKKKELRILVQILVETIVFS